MREKATTARQGGCGVRGRVLAHATMLLACLPSLAGAAAASPQPAGCHAQELATGFPVERPITGGEAHRFEIRARAGEYIEVALDPRGVDLGARLAAVDGVVLASRAYRRPGRIALAAVARSAGCTLLEIRALDAAPVSGNYAVELTARRPAAPRDARRARALRVLSEADALHADWHIDRAGAVLARYRRALDAWRATSDLAGQAACEARLGEVHQVLGQPEVALASFEESLRLARRASSGEAECAALWSGARVLLDLGRNDEARARVSQAIQLGRVSGDRTCEAEALNVAGDLAMFTGEERQSVSLYTRALSISRDLGDRRGQARASLNLGYAAMDLGDVTEARSVFEAALAWWRGVEDRRGEVATVIGLASLHLSLGDTSAALGRLREARPLAESLGDRVALATILSSLGRVHFRLGEAEAAVTYYRRCVDLFRDVKIAIAEATNRLPLGLALAAAGRHDEAIQQYERALENIVSLEDRRLEGRAREHLARSYVATGRTQDATNQYRLARSLAAATHDPSGEAYALDGLGELLIQQGRIAEGLPLLGEALAAARQSQEPFAQSLALFGLARAKARTGDVHAALDDLRRSLELVESLRGAVDSLDLRASYVASVRDRHDLEVELLMRLHTQEPTGGYDGLAFEASERARARSLLDGLAEARAGIHEGVDAGVLEREQALRDAVNAKAQRLVRIPSGAVHDRERAAVSAEIDALTIEHGDVQSQIRAASPAYAALMQPRAMTLREVQQLVTDDDGSVLVEYFLGSRVSVVWTVSAEGVAAAALPPREEIERRVRPYVEGLAAPSRPGPQADAGARLLRAESERISALLLGPVAERLRGRRLLFVADGILHRLPFAALLDPTAAPGPSGERALVAAHEIIHLPSASTLGLLRRDWHREGRWPKAVMVFADPVFEADDPRIPDHAARSGRPDEGHPGAAARSPRRMAAAAPDAQPTSRQTDAFAGGSIPRLLGSRREARAIAALSPLVDVTLDFAANRAAVMDSRIGDYRIVHFATHGVVDHARPALSGIVLSLFDEKGRVTPGFLRLHDIYNLSLPVDLVVLSACNTAVGKDVVGEGLIGLVRGFMYAGSRRVLATLWRVDDHATSEAMTRFYRGVLERGLDPAAALREAQAEMSRDPRWADPFYWAPFVLQGDWR